MAAYPRLSLSRSQVAKVARSASAMSRARLATIHTCSSSHCTPDRSSVHPPSWQVVARMEEQVEEQEVPPG